MNRPILVQQQPELEDCFVTARGSLDILDTLVEHYHDRAKATRNRALERAMEQMRFLLTDVSEAVRQIDRQVTGND